MITSPRTAAIARLLLDPDMERNERALIAHIIRHGAFKDPTEQEGWLVGLNAHGILTYFSCKPNVIGSTVRCSNITRICALMGI